MKDTKEIAEAKADWKARICSSQYVCKGIEERKFSGAMPSQMELATLAATLASGPANNKAGPIPEGDDILLASGPDNSPKTLCVSALKLWFASRDIINLQQQCNEDYQQLHRQLEAAQEARPKPPKDQQWPMTLQAYCRINWPDKDTGERAAIIRQWLKDNPGATGGISYATMNGWQIDKSRFAFLRATLLPWYQRRKAAQTSAKRRDAANKRHRKARPNVEKLKQILQERGLT